MIYNKKLQLSGPNGALPAGHVTLNMAGLMPDIVKRKSTRGGLVVIEWLKKPETQDVDNREMLSIHADTFVTWARNHLISREDLEENMTRITDERYGKRRTQRTPPPGKGGGIKQIRNPHKESRRPSQQRQEGEVRSKIPPLRVRRPEEIAS